MRRVLVVDNHAPAVRVLRLGLEDAGYELDLANNAPECLVKLLDNHPDLLITDLDLPRMDGRALCMAIEEQYPQRTFPIVVLTSRAEFMHRDWTREVANLTLMEKPISMRRLLSHLSQCFSSCRQKTGT